MVGSRRGDYLLPYPPPRSPSKEDLLSGRTEEIWMLVPSLSCGVGDLKVSQKAGKDFTIEQN